MATETVVIERQQRTFLGILIAILVIAFIFALLFGAFRKRGRLSAEELNSLRSLNRSKSLTPDAQQTFSKLWQDHVSLTRDYILAFFRNKPEKDSIEENLLQNQTDIANAIDEYYPGSGDLIESLLKEHILIAKDILTDLRKPRLERIVGDLNRWYKNADEFADAMTTINPKWDFRDMFNNHLRITEQEVLAEWVGLKKLSENIYKNQIEPQAQDMAAETINGLKIEFPANPQYGDTFVSDGVEYIWLCIQLNNPPNGQPCTDDWYSSDYVKSLNLVG